MDKYIKKNLYAYSYNSLNNVYIIRGVSDEEASFEPRTISHIPGGLLSQIESEYLSDSIWDYHLQKISFSADRYHAILDFHGRTFDAEQVARILNGEFVDVPYKTIEKPKTRNFKRK